MCLQNGFSFVYFAHDVCFWSTQFAGLLSTTYIRTICQLLRSFNNSRDLNIQWTEKSPPGSNRLAHLKVWSQIRRSSHKWKVWRFRRISRVFQSFQHEFRSGWYLSLWIFSFTYFTRFHKFGCAHKSQFIYVCFQRFTSRNFTSRIRRYFTKIPQWFKDLQTRIHKSFSLVLAKTQKFHKYFRRFRIWY